MQGRGVSGLGRRPGLSVWINDIVMKAQWHKGFKDIVQREFSVISGGRHMDREGRQDREDLTDKKKPKQKQRG